MKQTKPALILCLAFLLNLLSPAAQASDSAWVIRRDSSYWEIQGGYGRFSESNALTQQYQFLAHAEIGFLETATLIMELPFLTRSLDRPGQTPATLTNNGLTDILIALRIRLLEEPFALALRAGTKIPTGYNPSFVPSLGDQQLDLELGLNGGYAFSPLEAYLQGGLAYRFRLNYDKTHAVVAQNPTIIKPADQLVGFLEAGAWILPQLFASVSLNGEFGLNQTNAWSQSQLLLRPLVAWRFNPYVDVSLQLDQSLWSQRQPFLTQVMAGAHFHYGLPLDRNKGLRGGVADYAERDDSID